MKKFQHSISTTLFLLVSFFAASLNIVAPLHASETPPRDYNAPLTKEDSEDIGYIVKSLAKYSWTELLGNRKALKDAGARVDPVHPLRFLECIFSSEELKAGVQAIRERKRIWKQFSDGLFDSLTKESGRNNLTNAQVLDFANTLRIDANKINPIIQKRQWTELVDKLIELLPRKGNPGRYDM